MSYSKTLVGVAIAAVTIFALAACTSAPRDWGNSATAIDAQYGIPPDSVPTYLLKPDGFMTNGLLPRQPYD